MLKTTLCAVGLCIAAGAASALETRWTFRYTGFENAETGQFVADWNYRGTFVGEDIDANGVLQQSELMSFSVDEFPDLMDPRACNPNRFCTLTGFSYDLHRGQLSFRANIVYEDEISYSSYTMVAGDRVSFGGYSPWGSTSVTWLWTDQTRFEISPPPVPEPAAAWLLGADLVAVGIAARRRS
ncbi:putative secreted protein with PEP-CTERM sorting signal [Pseudoduganella flava]|uniref:Putative secreted protein with PEP-CTERM sorting signal n=1 Tax=Pseudoduganella flava TaxID=871742 RepID=A0A562PQC1_9BURK|nr:hypothetical protein [Pseudoduganella flava]QGZ37823.1 hypothetical protein GO485_01325 [Pseudoduganella flava]TWI46647.1 putative secreted protein with PEP-CTERM sorting signal [Pseudoduganella flava]